MNKLFTKIAAVVLGAAMAVGVGVAVAKGGKEANPVNAAGDTTFTTTSSGGFSNNTKTTNGVTVTFGGSPSWQSGHVRVYAGATVSFSSSSESITKIVVNHTSTGSYPINWSSNPSGISSATWTGDSSSVVLTNASSKQVRLTSIVVTTVASKTLSGIGVNTAPTKTSYLEGEYFNPSGLVISRTWSSGDPDTYAYDGHTSEFTFSPTTSTALTTANTSVTITYGGKSTSQTITVTAPKTPASVSSSGQTTTFDTGDTFVYGGTLTATYTDSTSAGVSPKSFKIGNAGINPISAGTVITPGSTVLNKDDHNGKTIYVLYTENNTTVYTSYVITVNGVSSVTFTAGTDTGSATSQDTAGTLTKSGISFYCSGWKNDSGTSYRLYKDKTVTFTSTVGNMTKVEFTGNDSSYKISNMNNDATSGTITTDAANNKSTWTGNATTFSFTMSAQGRASTVVVTLASTDPLVELDVSSATSVSMMKGDTDESVKVHVANITTKTWTFTYDEGGNTGLSTSSYINVVAGAAISDVHTLTITTKAVGSTVLHIAVSGTTCPTTIPVTVAAKPASMTIVHSDIHEGTIEIITGAYKQVSFTGKDTDGNDYIINAADVTPSATSGGSYVTLSGSRITGESEGDAVVRYTLNALTSVYAELTVNVVDDYIETVGSPTFATGLTDTQGNSPDVSVFTSRPGTMHSGTATTVPFENYKFSYDSTYASSEYGSVFSYDFAHGSTVDPTHKLQTIYVFCDIDQAAHGSYTVTVEQLDDPLREIHFTNVTDNKVDVTRGNTFQLEWAYTPTNPTDGKEVNFRIDTNTDDIDISVSALGLISIGASSNLGDALVIVESAHDETIYDYVLVTATMESMTYTVREAESWTKANSIAVGDIIIIVNETATRELTEVNASNVGVATTYSTAPAHTFPLTVGAGNAEGTFTLSNNGSYLAYTNASTSKNNNLYTLSNPSGTDQLNQVSWTIEISNGDATITNVYNTSRELQYNASSGQERFCCYVTSQTAVQIYKKSGGDVQMNVTEDLFNAVHNNFGAGKTYEWSDSCPSFDGDAWTDACAVIVDLADYDDYKLNRAVANLSGNEIEVFLAKYDVVVSKFGVNDYDYLGRFQTGGINESQKVINPIQIVQNGDSIAIVVIVSVISLSAIGGYFFLRKRKETN